MHTQQRGFTWMIVVLALALVILGGGLYYALHAPRVSAPASAPEVVVTSTSTPTSPTSTVSEDIPKESFSKQPASVKSIAKVDRSWSFALDLLTQNPKWIPGGIIDAGGFFINQSTKVRYLGIATDAKAFKCDGANATREVTPASFVADVESILARAKTEPGVVGEFGYAAYFDIKGNAITGLYEQCLP